PRHDDHRLRHGGHRGGRARRAWRRRRRACRRVRREGRGGAARMMNFLLVAPIAVPLATLVLCLLLRGQHALVRRISVTGGVVLLVVGLALVGLAGSDVVLAGQLGNWPAPYGITAV